MAAQNNSADAGARAELKFQQVARRKQEADQAVKDQVSARESEHHKTARLRALRLAKEEADREAAAVLAAENASAPPKKRASRKKVA
jgi:hypothetical protein